MGGRFFPLTLSASFSNSLCKLGGRKLKNNLQIYEGVRIPSASTMKIAA